MLSVGVGLGLLSVYLEVFIVRHWRVFGFLRTHPKWGLVFSFFLSVGIGYPFDARGVTALFAAISSTAIMSFIYNTNALRLLDEWELRKSAIYTQAKQVLDVSVKTVVTLWKIVTAPVRFYLWVKSLFVRYTAMIRRVAAHL